MDRIRERQSSPNLISPHGSVVGGDGDRAGDALLTHAAPPKAADSCLTL